MLTVHLNQRGCESSLSATIPYKKNGNFRQNCNYTPGLSIIISRPQHEGTIRGLMGEGAALFVIPIYPKSPLHRRAKFALRLVVLRPTQDSHTNWPFAHRPQALRWNSNWKPRAANGPQMKLKSIATLCCASDMSAMFI
jgi:hypothetical protein